MGGRGGTARVPRARSGTKRSEGAEGAARETSKRIVTGRKERGARFQKERACAHEREVGRPGMEGWLDPAARQWQQRAREDKEVLIPLRDAGRAERKEETRGGVETT